MICPLRSLDEKKKKKKVVPDCGCFAIAKSGKTWLQSNKRKITQGEKKDNPNQFNGPELGVRDDPALIKCDKEKKQKPIWRNTLSQTRGFTSRRADRGSHTEES